MRITPPTAHPPIPSLCSRSQNPQYETLGKIARPAALRERSNLTDSKPLVETFQYTSLFYSPGVRSRWQPQPRGTGKQPREAEAQQRLPEEGRQYSWAAPPSCCSGCSQISCTPHPGASFLFSPLPPSPAATACAPPGGGAESEMLPPPSSRQQSCRSIQVSQDAAPGQGGLCTPVPAVALESQSRAADTPCEATTGEVGCRKPPAGLASF